MRVFLHHFLDDAVVDNHVGWATITWDATGAIRVQHGFVGYGRRLGTATSNDLDPDRAVSDPSSWHRRA